MSEFHDCETRDASLCFIKAQEFIAPYAALSDEFLVEIAMSNPGNAHIIHGSVSLTSHVAASVMAFRAAVAKSGGR